MNLLFVVLFVPRRALCAWFLPWQRWQRNSLAVETLARSRARSRVVFENGEMMETILRYPRDYILKAAGGQPSVFRMPREGRKAMDEKAL